MAKCNQLTSRPFKGLTTLYLYTYIYDIYNSSQESFTHLFYLLFAATLKQLYFLIGFVQFQLFHYKNY